MAEYSLILDIDELGIKALVVNETIQGAIIHDKCHVFTNELPAPEELEQDQEYNQFFETFKLISKKIDLKDCTTATLFIPSSIISFRNTILPFKSKGKLKQVLDYELGFMLPLNNTEYLSDFTLTDIPLSVDQNFIFSASIPEHFIKNYFNSLDHFGIKPELITIKGYVKAGWFAKKEALPKIAFLDIQGDENTLTFVVNNKAVFVRSLKSSGSTQKLGQAIFNTYIGFKQKIRSDLMFDKVIITSDKTTNIETNDELINILNSKFQCPIEYAEVEEDLLSFLIKEKRNLLNLCQEQYKNDSFFKKNTHKFFATVAIAAFVCILFFFHLFLDISSLENNLSLYKDAQVKIFKQTFPKQTKIIDPFMQMQGLVSSVKNGKSNKTTNILKEKGVRAIDLLHELSERIPENVDIVVSRILFNNSRLILSGSTNNFNNIDKIKNGLEKSNIFPNVKISKATADKKKGNVLFKFIIKF